MLYYSTLAAPVMSIQGGGQALAYNVRALCEQLAAASVGSRRVAGSHVAAFEETPRDAIEDCVQRLCRHVEGTMSRPVHKQHGCSSAALPHGGRLPAERVLAKFSRYCSLC